jgi:outer membrane protein assembly factor BamD (BamD/ComL family)
MSVSSFSASSFFDHASSAAQPPNQPVHQAIQQLGQDLQAGNLTAAQADFATLEQDSKFVSGAANSTTSSAQSSSSSHSPNPMAQAFNQLAQDLQSGNLTAAQQDFTNIQTDIQNIQSSAQVHHHQGSGSGASEVANLLSEVGGAVTGGQLSAALQAYGLLSQGVPLLGGIPGSAAGQSGSTVGSLSVSG